MRRRHSIMMLIFLGSVSSAAYAESSRRSYELGYFLPKTKVGAKVAERLVECPTGGEDPKFETSLIIASKAIADPRLIRVDARKGFLAKRTTELKLRPDGTLEAFNASNEGQGGLLLSALIKVGATVATGGMGAVPAPYSCTAQVQDDLAEHARLREMIMGLEALMASGEATPATASELALSRTQLQQVEGRLTVTSSASAIDPPRGTTEGVAYIKPTDVSGFFDVPQSGASKFAEFLGKRPGRFGFGVSWKADAAMVKALSTNIALPDRATPGLFYRRPVPASVAVHACGAAPASETIVCAEDTSPAGKAMSASGTATFPQLSGYFSIPIGRGGLFGSEEAAAEFDATGAPTRLKYGSDPGASAIAGVIDTARGAYVSMEKAPAAAEQAELEALKRRKEIRELEHELSKPLT